MTKLCVVYLALCAQAVCSLSRHCVPKLCVDYLGLCDQAVCSLSRLV